MASVDYVIVGSWFGWLRFGRAAFRGPESTRRIAGSRRCRRSPRDSHSRRIFETFQIAARLELRDRAAGTSSRPGALLAARESSRRLEFDQRHDLHPRESGGLQRLGGAGKSWLGVRGGAALFSEVGRSGARGLGAAWSGRAAARGGFADCKSVVARVRGGGDCGGAAGEFGFQWSARRKASAFIR